MTWKPRKSGNPAGRPTGTRNHATILAERLLSDDIESVCRSVVDAAKSGDMTAARLIIERIVPATRTRRIALDLPPVKTATDILDAQGRVIAAMSSGDISADEAWLSAAFSTATASPSRRSSWTRGSRRLRRGAASDPEVSDPGT